MSRREQIAIVAITIVVFAAPLVLMVAGVRPGLDENRDPTAAPSLTARSATNDATWAQLGDYLTDRLPLRDKAIQVDTDLRQRVAIADAAEEGVPRGDHGWLYHSDTLLESCAGPAPARFFEAGGEVSRSADRVGIPFLFVVVPDKVVIHPEHQVAPGLTGPLGLADATELPGCAALWVEALESHSDGAGWLWDLRPELSARRDLGAPLYFRQDTHWTDAGAMVFVEGLLDRLAPRAFDPAHVRPNGQQVARADLAKLKGTASGETQPQLEVTRPGVTVVEADLNDDDQAVSRVARSRAVTTDAPLVEGTTVVLGDSFTRLSLRLLAPYFEELVFLQAPYLEHARIGDALEGRDADRIVIVQVQRNVAKGWYPTFTESALEHLVGG